MRDILCTQYIMMCQDLVRYYARKNVRPSYIMEVDMKKAYDVIDWEFSKRCW